MNITEVQFSKLVDILSNDSFNARDVAITLAKVDPALFLNIVEGKAASLPKVGVNGQPLGEFIRTIANNINAGEKVSAIKLFRAFTGSGLKEAKDCVDYASGYYVGTSFRPLEQYQKLTNQIMEYIA